MESDLNRDSGKICYVETIVNKNVQVCWWNDRDPSPFSNHLPPTIFHPYATTQPYPCFVRELCIVFRHFMLLSNEHSKFDKVRIRVVNKYFRSLLCNCVLCDLILGVCFGKNIFVI